MKKLQSIFTAALFLTTLSCAKQEEMLENKDLFSVNKQVSGGTTTSNSSTNLRHRIKRQTPTPQPSRVELPEKLYFISSIPPQTVFSRGIFSTLTGFVDCFQNFLRNIPLSTEIRERNQSLLTGCIGINTGRSRLSLDQQFSDYIARLRELIAPDELLQNTFIIASVNRLSSASKLLEAALHKHQPEDLYLYEIDTRLILRNLVLDSERSISIRNVYNLKTNNEENPDQFGLVTVNPGSIVGSAKIYVKNNHKVNSVTDPFSLRITNYKDILPNKNYTRNFPASLSLIKIPQATNLSSILRSMRDAVLHPLILNSSLSLENFSHQRLLETIDNVVRVAVLELESSENDIADLLELCLYSEYPKYNQGPPPPPPGAAGACASASRRRRDTSNSTKTCSKPKPILVKPVCFPRKKANLQIERLTIREGLKDNNITSSTTLWYDDFNDDKSYLVSVPAVVNSLPRPSNMASGIPSIIYTWKIRKGRCKFKYRTNGARTPQPYAYIMPLKVNKKEICTLQVTATDMYRNSTSKSVDLAVKPMSFGVELHMSTYDFDKNTRVNLGWDLTMYHKAPNVIITGVDRKGANFKKVCTFSKYSGTEKECYGIVDRSSVKYMSQLNLAVDYPFWSSTELLTGYLALRRDYIVRICAEKLLTQIKVCGDIKLLVKIDGDMKFTVDFRYLGGYYIRHLLYSQSWITNEWYKHQVKKPEYDITYNRRYVLCPPAPVIVTESVSSYCSNGRFIEANGYAHEWR